MERARELSEVAEENEYAVWATLATMVEGVALSGMGRPDEGLIMTEKAIDLYQGLTAPPVFWPQILALRAMVHAMAGKPDRGLALIEEAIAIGGPNDVSSPDFAVVKGDLLQTVTQPKLEAAEGAYLSAAQGAKAVGLFLVELQALTRLVALRRASGRTPDGSEELAAAYAGFTEGFDEHDLVVARELLG